MKLAYNDRVHGYWLDGKRCKGASSLGKTIDDTHALTQWTLHQVAKGIALRPQLIEFIAAHIDDYKALMKACDEARDAAGSNDASRRGTVLHKILERVDLGLEVYPTPMATAVQDAWRQALADAGLTILPNWVERVVVHPDLHIAGTLDRIVRRADGTYAVLDIKGGARATTYPNSISVQLAIYARAPLAAAGNPERDGGSVVWDSFEPLPTMDTQSGYIAHIPEDNGEVFIHEIDIDSGWRAVHDLIRPVLAWQGQRVETRQVCEVRIPDIAAAPTPAVPVDPFAGLPDGKDLAWEIRKPVAATPSSLSATVPGPSTSSAPANRAPTSGTTSPSPFDDLPMPSTTTAPASPAASPRDSDGWNQYQEETPCPTTAPSSPFPTPSTTLEQPGSVMPNTTYGTTTTTATTAALTTTATQGATTRTTTTTVPTTPTTLTDDPFTESPEVQAERALQRRLVLRTDGDLVPAGIVESMGQAIQAQKDRNAIYLRWISEAIATGMPLRIKGAPQNTERGQHLADLICAAFKHCDDVMADWQEAVEQRLHDTEAEATKPLRVPNKPKVTPDDIIRAAVVAALPDVECFAFPTITTGAILTSLNHLEAEAAAGIAQAIRNGEARLSRRRDGSYHVASAA